MRWIRISSERPPLGAVFGPLDEETTGRVLAQLERAEALLFGLRDALAATTGTTWTSPGLLLAASDRLGSGHVIGWVEGGGAIAVSAELHPRWDTRGWRRGDPWRVGIDAWDLEGEVRLYTEENRERAGDVVAQIPEHRVHRPDDAARALADVCARLAGAVRSRPPDAASWRLRRS